MLIISLPVPPSSNMAYRNVPGVGRVKTSDHKAWKREAGIIAKLQFRQQGSPVIGKPYRMMIKVNINRRGDIMNREKLLTDLLVELGIIPDDCWCDEITIYRSPHIPGCEVRIKEMGPESGASGPATQRGSGPK